MRYKDIAIGVLQRGDSVCLSMRQSHQSFSGSWEFPGGKIELDETNEAALQRECLEELGVKTESWSPLMNVPWLYESVAVRLHVFTTEKMIGEPIGKEGQKVRWFSVTDLNELDFPQANRGIIMALQLADKYMISGSFDDEKDALDRLQKALDSGMTLCQLRAKNMPESDFIPLAEKAIGLAHRSGAQILLNGSPKLLETLPDADGLQLASNVIFDYTERPIPAGKLLGVSTHTKREIAQAFKIGADFILLSPVKETSSHPGIPGIGWETFAEMVKEIPVPVYALGGMKPSDVDQAKALGGQGVAAISGFWPSRVD